MMKWTIHVAVGAALVLAFGGTAAVAQERTGYKAISAGDYAKAERVLVRERRIHPEQPALMLNLAGVYRHQGRTAEAGALYRQVLAAPDELMDVTPERTASSHALATLGLQSLGGTTAVASEI